MTTRVTIIYRIVIAIAIQVQAVDGFGVQVGGIIGRDESAPLRAVVSCVAVVQTRIVVVVIATVANGIGVCNGVVGGAGSNGTIAYTYTLPNLPHAVKEKPPRP